MKVRNIILIAFAALIATGVVASMIVLNQSRSQSSTPAGHRSLAGQVACLPKKGSGPQTLECALGLKTSDGTYYAVKNGNDSVREAFIRNSIGTKVKVSGEVASPDLGEIYDIAGTIIASEVTVE